MTERFGRTMMLQVADCADFYILADGDAEVALMTVDPERLIVAVAGQGRGKRVPYRAEPFQRTDI
jgi:hypothetical protein